MKPFLGSTSIAKLLVTLLPRAQNPCLRLLQASSILLALLLENEILFSNDWALKWTTLLLIAQRSISSDLAGPRADKGKYVVVSGALGYSTSHSTELFGKIYRDGTLTLLGSSWYQPRKANFKFFNMWVEHYDYNSLLLDHWYAKVYGSPIYVICRRLKLLKGLLKQLNKFHFGHILERVRRVEAELEQHQSLLQDYRDNVQLLAQYRKLRLEVVNLKSLEKMFHSQKLKSSEVGKVFVNFFQQLLGTSRATSPLDGSVVCYGPYVDSSLHTSLLATVSYADIKKALFSIDDTKFPSPDGYFAFFFKKSWDVVGPDLYVVLQDFFNSSQLLKQINHSIIALVPKSPHLGFLDIFVHLVMTCVETTSYSVAVNGELFRFFPGRCGVRHGDPLSPYIFIICMEYLSRMLNVASQNPSFWFHPKCQALGLSYLSFADDIILLCRGDINSVQVLLQQLMLFGQTFGLNINISKSSKYFGGVIDRVQQSILADTGFSAGAFLFRYLEVPLSPHRLLASQYSPLIHKLEAAIQGWLGKHLSYAGRFELINSVLYGMVQFWISIFPMPRAVIRQITYLYKNFLWTGDTYRSKSALVAWKIVCLSKNEGGLGLLDIQVGLNRKVDSLLMLMPLSGRQRKIMSTYFFGATRHSLYGAW
ncbi:uncharacterized protein [Populus alba]|uniref:uncharacterized protein n=1 Tax=Populus alba TaxID=43335 RepID=UPI003CC7686F